MRQVIGFTLATIVLLFVLYLFLLLKNDQNKQVNNDVYDMEGREFFISFAGNGSDQKVSIKQIDSLSAEMNLDFTIRNAVNYGVKLSDGNEKE